MPFPPTSATSVDELSADPLAAAQPFELPALDDAGIERAEQSGTDTGPEIEVEVELGRAWLTAEGVAELRAGSIVGLDKLAADPVDILAEGRLVARGEVLILEGKCCVRIAEVLPQW